MKPKLQFFYPGCCIDFRLRRNGSMVGPQYGETEGTVAASRSQRDYFSHRNCQRTITTSLRRHSRRRVAGACWAAGRQRAAGLP